MRFHRPTRHVELPRNFGVVTSLQQKLDDLLLSWTQPYHALFHKSFPREPEVLLVTQTAVTNCCSTHHATLRQIRL